MLYTVESGLFNQLRRYIFLHLHSVRFEYGRNLDWVQVQPIAPWSALPPEEGATKPSSFVKVA
jgi:hypothetical protein